MRKEFILNSGLLLVLNVLIKPIYVLVVETQVQNEVKTETYGQYFSLIAFIYFFQFINEFGFSQFLRKYLSENRSQISTSFPVLLLLKIAFSVLFLIVVLIANYVFGYEEQDVLLLLLISINFAIASLLQVYRSGIASLGRYTIDSFLSVLDKSLLIVLLVIFLYADDYVSFTIYTFVYCQLASLLIGLGVAMMLFYNGIQISFMRINRKQSLEFIKRAAPFAMVILLMSVYGRLDGVMLREMLPDGYYQAGKYAAAYRLFEGANMFALLIGALLLPIVSLMLSRNEPINDLINMSVKLMTMITLVVAVLSIFYGEQIMQLLYIEYRQGWGRVLSWLMLGLIPIGLGHVFGVLLMANNQVKYLNYIYLIALCSNIMLNVVLIPRYQAEGAAIATFLTQVFVIIAEIILFTSTYKWYLQNGIQLSIFILGSVFVVYGISQIEYFPWIIGLIGSGILIGMMGLLLNILSVDEIRQLLDKRHEQY